MEELDQTLNEFVALIELMHETCHLNHGKGADIPQAVDYLCQYVGPTDSDVGTALLRIPICAECITTLYDKDWILFYCLTCNSSQWLMRSKAKKHYPEIESIKFLAQCPNCTEAEEELKDKLDK